MQKQSIPLIFNKYDTWNELPAEDLSLLQAAKKALETSYSPYSKFKVGAAARLKNDEIVSGSNMENAAYPLCICAEQAVLAAASSKFPGVPVVAIAVTVKNSSQMIAEPAAPCGACRQVICETEQRYREKIKVIVAGEEGAVYVFESGKSLLPLAFDGSFL